MLREPPIKSVLECYKEFLSQSYPSHTKHFCKRALRCVYISSSKSSESQYLPEFASIDRMYLAELRKEKHCELQTKVSLYAYRQSIHTCRILPRINRKQPTTQRRNRAFTYSLAIHLIKFIK